MPTILQVGLFICLILGGTEIRKSFREGNTLLGLGFIVVTLATAWIWYVAASNW